MSKKSALARKREAQEARRRRKRLLMTIGIGAAVVVAKPVPSLAVFDLGGYNQRKIYPRIPITVYEISNPYRQPL